MNPDDPNQDRLQEALATLRHQPPPRDLTARVRQRLEHPEPPPPPTLLQRLGFEIEGRPVLVGLSGAAICLLLVAAVLAARNVQPPPAPPAPGTLAGQPDAGALMQFAPPQAPEVQTGQLPRSTDPVLVTPASSTDRLPMRTRPSPGNGPVPQ